VVLVPVGQTLCIFASKKVYMFFYGVIGIVKGMQYTYLSAMLSTIERKFGIKSRETAILMSGNEMAQVLFLFFMPLTLKAKKRPMWCAIGMMITALGLYIMALPHFITGYNHLDTMVEGEGGEKQGLCQSDIHVNSLEGSCNEDGTRIVDWVGLIIVFAGIAATGIGNSLFWCFGMVYLDDNSAKGNTPFFLSLTFVFRLVGPTLGYMLGAKCLTTYVYPGLEPDYDETDPRWIGAWWIGFPVIATLLLIFSIPLCLFPERLPREDTDANKEAKEMEKLVDSEKKDRGAFIPALKRLLSNKLYVYNFFSSIFFVFAFMGFGTFAAKYIEYQFRITASGGARVSGSAGTAAKAIGFLISGWLIGKYRFSARTLATWNVIIGLCVFASFIAFGFVGCTSSQMYGQMTESGVYNITVDCNLHCGCPVSRMTPICSKDGVTNFYSPCHAGCLDVDHKSDVGWLTSDVNTTVSTKGRIGKKKDQVYSNCSCVATASEEFNTSMSRYWIEEDILNTFTHPPPDNVIEDTFRRWMGVPVTEAVHGWCEVPGCKQNFYIWIAVAGVLSIIGSTGRVGNVLVALRCVEVRDKALSFAFQIVFMSLLAMLPSPIIFGSIIDKTCLLWQEECGETTNCLLYDTDKLREHLMFTTAGIMFFGVLFDVAVVYYSKDLKIFDDPKEDKPDVVLTKKTLLDVPENDLIYGSQRSLAKDLMFKE